MDLFHPDEGRRDKCRTVEIKEHRFITLKTLENTANLGLQYIARLRIRMAPSWQFTLVRLNGHNLEQRIPCILQYGIVLCIVLSGPSPELTPGTIPSSMDPVLGTNIQGKARKGFRGHVVERPTGQREPVSSGRTSWALTLAHRRIGSALQGTQRNDGATRNTPLRERTHSMASSCK